MIKIGECNAVEERGEILKKLMALDTRQNVDTRQRMGGYEVKTEDDDEDFRYGCKGHECPWGGF